MEKPEPIVPAEGEDSPATDLARRLARYRRRIEAEGRPRSVRFIERAIVDAGKKAGSGE